MPVSRKFSLGPAVATKCDSCHEKIGVPYYSMLVALSPFLLSIFLTLKLESILSMITVVLLGFIAMTLIHLYVIPIVKK